MSGEAVGILQKTVKNALRRRLYRILLGFALVLIAGAGWIVSRSEGEFQFQPHNKLLPLVQVPPAQNMLEGMKRLADADSLLTPEQQKQLIDVLKAEEFDRPLAQTLVDSSRAGVDTAIAALARPALQSPIDALPGYSVREFPGAVLTRLFLLRSKLAADDGAIDQAIVEIRYALRLAEAIKLDALALLVNYQSGQHLERLCLLWMQHLMANYLLDDQQLDQLYLLVDAIPDYEDEHFALLLSGEFQQTLAYFRQRHEASMWQRWQQYRDNRELLFYQEDSSSSLYHALQIPLFRYYLRSEAVFSRAENFYANMQVLMRDVCGGDMFLAKTDWEDAVVAASWKDIVSPGSANAFIYQQMSTAADYYYSARAQNCLAFTHIEATKGIIAVQRYLQATGSLPERMEDLVPQFLTQPPKDYFLGGELGYSKRKGWFHSLGIDLEYDGGSVKGTISEDCFDRTLCRYDPTFPLAHLPQP